MPNGMQSLLRGAPSDELHALGDNIWPGVFDQEVDVIRRHDVIEHAKTETLLGLEHPVQITTTITGKRSKDS